MSQQFQLGSEFHVPLRALRTRARRRIHRFLQAITLQHVTRDASRLERSRSLTALSSICPLSFPVAGFATGKGRKAEFSGAFSLLTRAIHVPIARSQTPASRRRPVVHCMRAHLHEVMFGLGANAKWRRALDSEACTPSFTRPEHAARKFRSTKHPGAAEMTRFPSLPRSTSNQSIFNLYSKVLFNTSLS